MNLNDLDLQERSMIALSILKGVSLMAQACGCEDCHTDYDKAHAEFLKWAKRMENEKAPNVRKLLPKLIKIASCFEKGD